MGNRTGLAIGALAASLLLCVPGAAQAASAGGPVNLAAPQITGTAQSGQTLSCSLGTWGGSVDSYAQQWQRNGGAIGAATGASYVVTDADVGQQITCMVTATGFAGSSSATSPAVVPTASGGSSPGSPGAPSTQVPLPSPAAVIEFPPAKKSRSCGSRRSFKIRIRKTTGVTYTSATVFVNRKQVKVVKGSRLIAPVDLRGLPKGKFTAKIVVTTDDGRTLTGTRKYKTCAKKRGPKGKRHRL